MFCPSCGAQNEPSQWYCRQCGQGLSAVQLAVEGKADQSLKRLQAGEWWVTQGSATVAAFTVIGVALAILGFALHDPTFSGIALINLLLGLAIGLPIIYVGRANLKRATRLLSRSQMESGISAIDQIAPPGALLTAGLNADLRGPLAQGSVTEHTTLDLLESKAKDHNPT